MPAPALSETFSLTARTSLHRVLPTDTTRSSALGTVSAFATLLQIAGGSGPASSVSGGLAWFTPPQGNLLQIGIYGTGADNATFKGRVWSLDALPGKEIDPGSEAIQWEPTLLVAFDGALSARTGISGGLLGTSYRYADTLTITDDRTILPNGVRKRGPGSGGVGATTPDDSWTWLLIDPLGSPLVGVELTRNGTAGTDATALNALVRGI